MNKLYNTSITKNSAIMGYNKYPNLNQNQTNEILGHFFEQLLLFDEIIISTDKDNFALYFLIKNLGLTFN
jgi:hypothetical protein